MTRNKVGGVTFIRIGGAQLSFCLPRDTRHVWNRNVTRARRCVLVAAALASSFVGFALDMRADTANAARHAIGNAWSLETSYSLYLVTSEGDAFKIDHGMTLGDCADWAPGDADFVCVPE